MKKYLIAIACILLFAGCFKDSCVSTYRIYIPVYQTLSQVRSNMKSFAAQDLQQTGKIYIYGNYIFLNEIDKGIHVIDNTNPAAPVNLSFIAVPGNVDLAVKGNYLYADSYSDLVVFDISHPSDIHTVKFVSNVFPYRSIYYYWGTSSNPDSINVVVDYIAKDTTVQCDTYNRWAYYNCPQCDYSSAPGLLTSIPSKGGTGGSMARFAVINNNLYTVSNSDVSDFDIADAANPQVQSTTSLGTWNAETIFPFNGKLFIGSSNGMFIYDVSNASTPVQLGQFSHVRSCDPVIADNNNAFVTLRSGTVCQGFSNQMEVMDIANLTNPVLLKTYSMTNPHGLSKDGNWLFVCDGTDGLKVYDAADVNNIQLKKQIPGIETYDVIATNNIAMVVAADGLYQFNYSDINNIQQLSKIAIEKN